MFDKMESDYLLANGEQMRGWGRPKKLLAKILHKTNSN
jgi:hypothetical protein